MQLSKIKLFQSVNICDITYLLSEVKVIGQLYQGCCRGILGAKQKSLLELFNDPSFPQGA